MGYDGSLKFDTRIDEQGFNKGISKLSSLAKSGVNAVSKAATGITAIMGTTSVALVKSSLDVVASMEQNIGGVETLFKESAGTVIANANKAFKTAGMSANDYMSTVTSFSASLLQSLGNDTKKAAAYADRAIVDMSDNANKMGTSMELIQNAYQGFAKQNYTMLDNLKLGYGGTKTEMERLVKDASKLKDVQKDLGITVDETSLSFGNVVNAISVMQKSMGIAGTTAQEASTTIEGSLDSAKAAWDNFLGGTTSADNLVDAFSVAADNIVKNLGEIAPRLATTVTEVIAQIVDKVGEAVPGVKGITDTVGGLIDKLQGMSTDELKNLGQITLTLAGVAPALGLFGKGLGTVQSAIGAFNGITDGMTSGVAKIPDAFKSVTDSAKDWGSKLGNLGDAIALPFQDLGAKVSPFIQQFGSKAAEIFNNGAGGKLVNATKNITKKVATGFGNIGPSLEQKFPNITEKLTSLSTHISDFGSKALGKFSAIGEKFSAYGGVIGDAFQPILQKAAGFVPGFLKCMNVTAGLGIVVAGLGLLYGQFGTQIDEILLMMQEKGPEVITNFCNGISAKIPELIAQGSVLLNNLMQTITANLPAIISGGISIVTSLITGMANQLPMLIPTAVQMILTLVTSLISSDNLSKIIDAGLSLLMGLVDGILNSLPILVDAIPEVITSLISTIVTNLPKIIQTGIKIISKLAVGLIKAIPQLVSKIPEIIKGIKDAFASVDWGEVGKNILEGIKDGLLGAVGALADAAVEVGGMALDAIKDFLGIHSPSHVFRDQVGKMMALGMGTGFTKNVPIKDMNEQVRKAVNGLKKEVEITTSVNSTGTVNGIKNNPVFTDERNRFDFDEYERRQRKLNKERDTKPIYLNGRQINRAVAKGELQFV